MTRQILKVTKYSDRARVTLSENEFNFCRVVFENFEPIIKSKYGSGKETNSTEEHRVRVSLIFKPFV